MKALDTSQIAKIVLATVIFLGLIATGSAESAFGTGTGEPLPNLTEIEIHDVTGLTGDSRETGGTLEDSGLNQTFSLYQNQSWREYRFGFRIRNDGDSAWEINGSDELYHEGLDTGWEINKTWYNISQDYDSGTFSSGKVSWNTSKGGTLSSGETMYAKYVVNISLTNSQQLDQYFLVNDTSNNTGSQDFHELDANKLGHLDVSIHDPVNDTAVTQNKTFLVNASAKCLEGECGEVNANTRYNESETADTIIPENSGKPFHTDGSNLKTCSNNLLKDQECYVNWDVNATGETDVYHLIDANFSSSFENVNGKDTRDNWVRVNTMVLLNLSWNNTKFGILDPGDQDKPAIGNSNLSYNVTVPEESNQADLWIKATDLVSESDSNYSIGADNLSYSLENSSSSSDPFSTSYESLKQAVSPGSVLNSFYWLDVPTGLVEGDYGGKIYVKANLTG